MRSWELKEKKQQKKSDHSIKIQVQKISRHPNFTERFRDDLAWWYKTDKLKANKILDLIEAIMREPFLGIGKPEPIKYLDPDT